VFLIGQQYGIGMAEDCFQSASSVAVGEELLSVAEETPIGCEMIG